jgi:hypothetical protein
MSEHVPEPTKPPSTPDHADSEDPWRLAFDEFKKRDEKMVKDYQEEIDTLLVFVRRPHCLFIPRLRALTSQAGLFSAVLTAFVVESYQSLQEDLAQTSADLLRQISHQLANSSYPAAPDSSHFQAQRSDVQVNVCWFVSLLLSLVVALFGIFLKQWMRTYMKWTDVTPDWEAVAIRQLRYRSLETWRLGAILALLPTLLQLSVILFLSGLLVFLWNLDRMVAHVMAALLAVTFFLVVAVTVLPAVSQSCPFRSLLSEIIAITLWRAAECAGLSLALILAFIQSGFRYRPDSERWRYLACAWHHRFKTTSWVQADEGVVARYNKREDDISFVTRYIEREDDHVSMRVAAMVHLCCTTQSQQLWSAALTAIVAEYPADNFIDSSPRIQLVYFNQVWWPLLGHGSMLTEEDLKADHSRWYWDLPSITTVAFNRLSLSMKDCWVSFLLHSKSLAHRSGSIRVVASYMICCLATAESTTGGPQCMQAFMEVLEAQYGNLEESQLRLVAKCLRVNFHSSEAALLDSPSGLSFPGKIVTWFEHNADIKFLQSVKIISDRLSTMPNINLGHRRLLDVLAQFACRVAMATTTELDEHIPEDLKDVLRALHLVEASDLSHMRSYIVNSCAPGLVFAAKHERDLFPKPFARAIVHKLEPIQLWNIACDVVGLDIEGIDTTRITDDEPGRKYLWESLDARTPNATERFIEPEVFSQILDAYEDQVKGTSRRDLVAGVAIRD